MQDKSYERSSLFLPFASLKGFQECLREKEELREERKLLSGDAHEELQRCLQRAEAGALLKITYYDGKRYTALQERLVKKELELQKRLLLGKKWIMLSDIIEIEHLEEKDHEGEMLF